MQYIRTISSKPGLLSKIPYREKIKCETLSQFLIGNRTVTNQYEIANESNKYFVNIGRLLSEQIISPHNSKEYLGDKSKFCLDLLL